MRDFHSSHENRPASYKGKKINKNKYGFPVCGNKDPVFLKFEIKDLTHTRASENGSHTRLTRVRSIFRCTRVCEIFDLKFKECGIL